MRLRMGLMMGFGAGYYLGAKAGKERYEQLQELLQRAKRSDTFGTAADKAKAVVDLTVERGREIVEDRAGRNHDAPSATTVPGDPLASI